MSAPTPNQRPRRSRPRSRADSERQPERSSQFPYLGKRLKVDVCGRLVEQNPNGRNGSGRKVILFSCATCGDRDSILPNQGSYIHDCRKPRAAAAPERRGLAARVLPVLEKTRAASEAGRHHRPASLA